MHWFFTSLTSIWIMHIIFDTLKVTAVVAKASIRNACQTVFKVKNSTEVLFFPDERISCKSFLQQNECKTTSCKYSHEKTSLSQLIHCLSSAKHSLDVCVFTITSQDLADVLIRQHKNGVKVRVLTDCEKMDLNCSQIEQFRANGIQVRHDKTSYFMHHKFAVVDNTLLINGSFNWTKQAITGNQENVIITNIEELLEPYKKQFNLLWEKYRPE